MDEAEVLCDRLVILDKGQVQVNGNPRALIGEHCAGYVAIWKPSERPRAEAKTLHELASVVESEAVKPEIIRPSNLEDVFLKITGRELATDA
jgi:lipooligosaccharide transport system ATP-binding protein